MGGASPAPPLLPIVEELGIEDSDRGEGGGRGESVRVMKGERGGRTVMIEVRERMSVTLILAIMHPTKGSSGFT